MIQFTILALACYRLSRLVAVEDGPGDCFLHLRGWICERSKNGGVCKGVCCPLCMSVWFGFALAACATHAGPFEYIAFALALSGATTFLHRMVG